VNAAHEERHSASIAGEARRCSISRREPIALLPPRTSCGSMRRGHRLSFRKGGMPSPKLSAARGACSVRELAVSRAVVRAIEMARGEFSGRHRR
jgi:hypothetical protein